MKLTSKTIIFIAAFGFTAICMSEPMIGRISVTSADEIDYLENMGIHIYHTEIEGVVDLLLDEMDIRKLRNLGYEPRDLTPLTNYPMVDLDPEYHTYEEFTAELQTLPSQYPNICKLDSIGRATQFPRTIWCLKLSDNVAEEEDELALYYIGTHHACEPLGGETILYMINHFLENYGTDPQITFWMNNYEIFCIPFINPDGHYAVTSGINEFWRKNARDINNNGIYYEFEGGTWWTDDHEGIDLNRNYNWHWDNGGSTNPWSYSYRGEAPFSENETSSIEVLARAQRFVCGMSFHSYGEVVLYPWSYNGQPAPDQDVLDVMANNLAQRFIRDNGSSYSYDTNSGLEGKCKNWFYGFAGAISFCIEVNPYPIFLPPGSQLQERTERYYNGAIYLLERMSGPGITGHVTDANTGSSLPARVEIQGRISPQVRSRYAEPAYGRYARMLNNGTYTVLSRMPGYQVARIEGIQVTDTLTVLDIELTPLTGQDEMDYVSDFSTDSESIIPNTIILFSPHPNPFNAFTAISYQLLAISYVNLTIYDIAGREVTRLVDGMKPAGSHQVIFDAEGLTSGVYFARLTTLPGAGTRQHEMVRKMLLVK